MEESNANNLTNVSKTKDSLTNSSTNFSSRTFSNSTTRNQLSIEEYESRRCGFEKFITSLPRICSPTICGTLNYYQTSTSRLISSEFSNTSNTNNTNASNTNNTNASNSNNTNASNTNNTNASNTNQANKQNRLEDTSGYQTSSCKVDTPLKDNSCTHSEATSCKSIGKCTKEVKTEFRNTFEEKINYHLNKEEKLKKNASNELKNENDDLANSEFDWSIDQMALLNPCDITFDDNFLIYKEFEELNKSLINKESDDFFKQKLIAPSPIVNTPQIARKRLLQNICKTSSPFIDYLNSKQPNVFKTPLQLSNIKESSNISSTKTPLNCNKNSHQLLTPMSSELTSTSNKLNLPKKKLFHEFDSTNSNSLNLTNSHLKCSMINKTIGSPALSLISPNQLVDNKLNCTDIDCRNFSLDISEIQYNDLSNLNESEMRTNQIKASTNRKELLKRVVEEDELCNDEEIKALDLNDTNEDDEEFKKIENELNKNEPDTVINKVINIQIDEFNESNEFKDFETNEMVEDVQMNSISIQPNDLKQNNTSMMDCSFVKVTDVQDVEEMKIVNNLDNNFVKNLEENQVFKQEEPANRDHNNLEFKDESFMDMEISSSIHFLDPNNFNSNKIDPSNVKQFKNQLTSTPFRF